jgi:hypothetical protein
MGPGISGSTRSMSRFVERGRLRFDLLLLGFAGVVCLSLAVMTSADKVDLHEYMSGPILIPKEPHNITKTKFPVTLGHEFAGIVEDVGDGVTNVSPGQRVVVRPTIYDGCCCSCKLGIEYCCENIGFIGLSGEQLFSLFLAGRS